MACSRPPRGAAATARGDAAGSGLPPGARGGTSRAAASAQERWRRPAASRGRRGDAASRSRGWHRGRGDSSSRWQALEGGAGWARGGLKHKRGTRRSRSRLPFFPVRFHSRVRELENATCQTPKKGGDTDFLGPAQFISPVVFLPSFRNLKHRTRKWPN